MNDVDVICKVSDNECRYWLDEVSKVLQGVKEVVRDLELSKTMLYVGKGEPLVLTGQRCITCDYDIVMSVNISLGREANVANMLIAIASYFVKQGLSGTEACALPVIGGASFYLAYLLAKHVDKEVYEYMSGLLSGASRDEARRILEAYSDILLRDGSNIVVSSDKVSDVTVLSSLIQRVSEFKNDISKQASVASLLQGELAGLSIGSLSELRESLRSVLGRLCRELTR